VKWPLSKIEELEGLRARLEDGKPCPLCGSTGHPFAEGNVPVPDEIEQKIESLTKLIDTADEEEATIKKLQEAETTARNNLTDSEKQETQAANDRKGAETTLEDLKDTLTKLQISFDELKLAITQKLDSLGYAIDFADPKSAIRNLQAKIQTWQEQVKIKTDIEKQIDAIDSDVKGLDFVIDTQVGVLREKQGKTKAAETRTG